MHNQQQSRWTIKQMDKDTRIAVVTGAAGGLGQAIANKLLNDGMHVIGVDIDAAGLNKMASDSFEGQVCDLTNPKKNCRFVCGLYYSWSRSHS